MLKLNSNLSRTWSSQILPTPTDFLGNSSGTHLEFELDPWYAALNSLDTVTGPSPLHSQGFVPLSHLAITVPTNIHALSCRRSQAKQSLDR
jgi:hypothetical protein